MRWVQGKVECSAAVYVVSCSAVGFAGCHSSIKNSVSHCWLLSSVENSFVLHDK